MRSAMWRHHLAAWLTAAFGVLLVLLAASDQTRDATGATVLLLVWAAVMLGLFVAVEHAARRRPGDAHR